MLLSKALGTRVKSDGGSFGTILNVAFVASKDGPGPNVYSARENVLSPVLDLFMKLDVLSDALLARYRTDFLLPLRDAKGDKVVVGPEGREGFRDMQLPYFYPPVMEGARIPVLRVLKRTVYLAPRLDVDYLYGRYLLRGSGSVGVIDDLDLASMELLVENDEGETVRYPLPKRGFSFDHHPDLGVVVTVGS